MFCVGRTQGSSRADTGEFFSDTGEFEGEFVLMGGSLVEANKVCFCMKDHNILNRINVVFWTSRLRRLGYMLN